METIDAEARARTRATKITDYARWSVEELRSFAGQMRVRRANQMNRRELLELLAPGNGTPAHEPPRGAGRERLSS